jgi:hypothetical protein
MRQTYIVVIHDQIPQRISLTNLPLPRSRRHHRGDFFSFRHHHRFRKLVLYLIPFSKEGKTAKISNKKKKTNRFTDHPGREMSSTKEERERLRVAALENSPPLPLWRLFREALLSGGACRDIVEKHVMCKLNGTDLKFFYEVNTETRKLIKRSSRASDLKKKFKIEEMSSISTLEVAWENKSLWSGDLCDERSSFCNKVARTNKLELLECVRDRINIIKRERIIQKRRRRRRRQQLKKLSFSKK